VQDVCGIRPGRPGKFHRELKLLGPESLPVPQARIQRHHIACAFAGWTRLRLIACLPGGGPFYQIEASNALRLLG